MEEQTKSEGVQLLERALKTPEPFIKWLNLQPKRKRIGTCSTKSLCPVASFLNWYLERDFVVGTNMICLSKDWGVSINTPTWLSRFIGRVDNKFQKAPITALQCLRELNRVMKTPR